MPERHGIKDEKVLAERIAAAHAAKKKIVASITHTGGRIDGNPRTGRRHMHKRR